jgi:DNA-binding transcriptional LysR family regulator
MSDDRALSMVAAGLGITVAPSSFRRPGLAQVKLIGLDLGRDMGLVFSDRVSAAGEPNAFADAVRATYRRRGAATQRKS